MFAVAMTQVKTSEIHQVKRTSVIWEVDMNSPAVSVARRGSPGRPSDTVKVALTRSRRVAVPPRRRTGGCGRDGGVACGVDAGRSAGRPTHAADRGGVGKKRHPVPHQPRRQGPPADGPAV